MSDALIAEAALAAAVAWGAGFRLYAVVLALGLLGGFGALDLPAPLQFLSHPLVLGVSGLLTLAEFVGDKIPYLDSVSDASHTFIRIPAGATSFTEESLLIGGLWLALAYPLAFLAGLAVFVLATLWMLRRLWRWLRAPKPPPAAA